MNEEKEPRSVGRPSKEMSEEELEKLVAMGCTDVEISAWFGMTVRTLQEKRKEEPYKTIFETAREKTQISLRRAQLKTALKGNASMLIWLGKVMLGQKDAVKLSGDSENPIAVDGKFTGAIEIILVEPKPNV
jgi:hypothetical protein